MDYENHFSVFYPLYKVLSFHTDIPEGSDVTNISQIKIAFVNYTGSGVNINTEFVFTF